MTKPLVSVIIPVYGAEQYLDEAILSVRNQTLKDIEIICVNDCSPDNSQAILEKHAHKDKRIKIIKHKENLYDGGARNTGIQNASADWLYFMDNDDILYEECCETLYKPTIKNEVDLVICDSYNTVDTILGTFHTGGVMSAQVQKLHDTIISLKDLNYKIHGLLPLAPWSKLHRKTFIVEHNILFPEHISSSDWSFALLEYGYCKQMFVIGKPLYKYKFLRKGSQTVIYGGFSPFQRAFESKIKIILDDVQIDNKIKSAVLINVIRIFYNYFCRIGKIHLAKNITYVSTILKEYQNILCLDRALDSRMIVEAFQAGDLHKIQSLKFYRVSRILNHFRFLWPWAYMGRYYIQKIKRHK